MIPILPHLQACIDAMAPDASFIIEMPAGLHGQPAAETKEGALNEISAKIR